MTTAVSFNKVSIVFGEKPEDALPLMDAGKSRTEVEEATGQILGVHDCSLDVAEGEILVLMGLSGSGKSTLLRAVNGLNPVVRGHVTVNDGAWQANVQKCAMSDLRKVRRECVSMVFQQFGLLPWRSVRENVALALELADVPKKDRLARADKQLALVGLSDWADRKVGDLSGGMQQRVGLARAFVTEAPILLMDEPFSALDPLIRSRLQEELLDLQRDLKRTIIFVSHDLDEAFKLGGRIAIMEGGRIVQVGTPREIFSKPASDYVADFVANMNPLGVLTARDVMQAETDVTGPTVAAETPVAELMQQLSGGETTLRVIEGDSVLGTVTAQSIVDRLSG
ncbi:Choline ABC transporter, ATP-binding protein [Sulfitobacter noctilucae]|uniref:choline ABC transporter ATP-binding protein n=1 Tax=Sulfitobacter noctilucae TaxID=1342302 RepID=UPI00046865BA|nr:choline ABC transporter ATP-binding protein [Sulfitobacter noctilucae]KIN60676.1 Choline ABC transporter, ATP-binding protein [Sulfitobacter noctilucae]